MDENDRVVGHDTKYNCKYDFLVATFFAEVMIVGYCAVKIAIG